MSFEVKVVLGLAGVMLASIFALWRHEKEHPCLRYERQMTTETYWHYINGMSIPFTNSVERDVCVERAP